MAFCAQASRYAQKRFENRSAPSAIDRRIQLPRAKALDEIVKLDLLANESDERVAEIWTQFHADKEFNFAEVWSTSHFYNFMAAKKSAGRLFIYPVPRNGGHFILLSEVQESHVLFTYLEDYKRDPSGAKPYLVITFYKELKNRDMVLVRGDITPAALDGAESARLLGLLKDFYIEKTDCVADFNKGKFDFEKHINDLLPATK
eukprot:CAMPEP_0172598654 /NCGR_PEP_ID=MMETSP1068-20121228/18706_1 /TAXON_ID=35684 /ORGANISM="Pseudopedinella elastica, Strain CCMP716" /LENGTH=202 /DNA_ID=CAMNT_0013398609 /DNA_START=162 /DNA_END=771 /DNA_ORIENTATION=+